MGFFSEFKQFAMRGNVVDLAVGVVIGGAFGKIVTALVDKIIMPPIGLMVGGIDFSKLSWTLKAATKDAQGKDIPAVVIAYGDFLNTIIQFVIIAFAVFIVIKALNRLSEKKEVEAPPAPPSENIVLLREIRDALQHKSNV